MQLELSAGLAAARGAAILCLAAARRRRRYAETILQGVGNDYPRGVRRLPLALRCERFGENGNFCALYVAI